MKNKNNTLYYDDYATDVASQVRTRIEQSEANNRDLLIVADTSAGKTTLATQLIVDFSNDKITSGIAAPLQSIVKSKTGSNQDIDFGFGNYFTMINEQSDNPFFTVYNTFSNSDLANNTRYLFTDEPQTLVQQANIRGVVNGTILDSPATKIYLTGTEWSLPQILDCDVIYLERNTPSKNKRIVKHYSTPDSDASIIVKISEHNKGKCTKIIRVNDKKVINTMAGQLKDMGFSVATYYSFDSQEAYVEENGAYLENNDLDTLRKGVFNDVDFVLCTSALDSGVDLVCDRNIYLYALGRWDYDRDTRIMPHPIDIKQFANRARNQENITVFVIGSYNEGSMKSSHFDGMEDFFAQIKKSVPDTMGYLRACNNLYSKAEYNDKDSYTEMLKYYNIPVYERGALETIGGIRVGLRSAISALKYINKSKSYVDIIDGSEYRITHNNKQHILTYDLGIDVDGLINDKPVLLSSADRVVIEDVASHIVKASSLGINLKPFLNDREFKLKELKGIIQCVDDINKATVLGRAIRDCISEETISKDRLRLLEGSGDLLQSFLVQYFSVRAAAFSRTDTKNIKIKGLKRSDKALPMPLIQYVSNAKPEWLSRIIDKAEKEALLFTAFTPETFKDLNEISIMSAIENLRINNQLQTI